MPDVQALAHALAEALAARRIIDSPRADRPVDPDAAAAVAEAFDGPALDQLERLGVRAVAADEPDREITVFVARKPRRAEADRLPGALGDIQMDYLSELLSPVQPLRLPAASRRAAPGAAQRVACGASISLGNDRAAGTLGALVRDRATGALMGLTCNHVTGGCNNTPVGMPVVTPAVLDVTAQTEAIRMIGRHARVLPLRQGQAHVVTDANTDVAVFDIVDPGAVTSRQSDLYDTPQTVADPEVGLAVEKVGRTTGRTEGTLRNALETDLLIPYKHTTHLAPDKQVTFQGVCYFADIKVVRGASGDFAKPGDSGSLVVTRGPGPQRAVGLLIGAGARTGYGYILPLGPILTRLEADLVSGHGV